MGRGNVPVWELRVLVGGWKKNVPRGQGKFKNTDGFIISGDFEDGIPSVWPTNIQIQNKSPIKVYKGEHITVDVQYVDKDGNPVNCYQGFTVSISRWFQKPKVPKLSKKVPNLPDPPKVTGSLKSISTPFFPAVAYPLCHFRNFVQSLHYPYCVAESQESLKPNEFLRQATYYITDLKDEILESKIVSEELLRVKGLKVPESMDHESGKWPLPVIEPASVNEDGSATFTNLTFPNADRPGVPYEPYLIDNYAKLLEKAKKKYGVYFGERPPDQKVDAIGRPLKDDSGDESE